MTLTTTPRRVRNRLMALPSEAGRRSVLVVRDRRALSGSRSARNTLVMVDGTTTAIAESVA